MDTYIDLPALARVLLVSLAAGVGLVSVFGVGLVGLSEYRGQMQGQTRGAGPAWLGLAGVCFLVVLAGAALGVYEIVG